MGEVPRMRLKGIELFGFKSFLDRTLLTFPPEGLTAIVGPNGCGKSNLVDAVLWALGEMRPTHLRGRSMEDVIFNGTEEVKPLGMAEVSLIFDTTQGAPSGFEGVEELRVTRRLFRSGESQYLINRRPCRLKDIRDLFLGTGLGVNAYAVVPQGEVEALVTAPPQQIRFMIEEAAGVSRYQERKREIIRKMESTRQNLQRLEDLLAEVHRQAGSLRYQASRARRFRRLREELRRLELLEAARRWQEERGHYEEMASRAASLRGELLGVQRRRQEVERKLEEREALLSEAREGVEVTERRALEVEGEIKAGEERIKALQRELLELQSRIAKGEEEAEGLEGAIADLRLKGEDLQGEVRGLEGDLRRVEGTLKALQQKLSQGEPLREELTKRREELGKELLEAEQGRVRLGNSLREARAKLQQMAEREKRLQGEVRRAEEELGVLRRKREELTRERKRLEATLREAEERLEHLRQRRKGLEGEISSAKGELSGLRGKLEALQMRREVLLRMEAEREGYPEAVKAILKDPPSVGLKEVAVLGDLLEVEPGYERAVEAALGERLRALVVETVEEALKVLKGAQGRVAVLPLEGRGTEGGELLGFVRARGCEGLLGRLLGGIRLVDRLPSEMPEKGGLVTKGGELLDERGTFWANLPMGLLERKNLLREIEAEIKELSSLLARRGRELEALEASLAALEQEEEAVRARVDSEGEVLGELKGTILQVEGRLEASSRRVELLKMELEELREGRRAWLKEEGELQRDLQQVEGRLKALREAMAEVEAELASRERERRDLEGRGGALREEMATLRERLRGKKAALEGVRERAERARQELERRRQDLQGLRQRLEDVSEARIKGAEALRQLAARREELSQLLAKERGHLEELQEEVEALKGELKEMRRREETLKEGLGKVEAGLQATAVEVEHLEHALRGTFGVEPSEAVEQLRGHPLPEGYRARIQQLRDALGKMGDVYMGAIEEYEAVKDRLRFLEAQKKDLERSLETLSRTLERINRRSRELFMETLGRTRETFAGLVQRLFGGGRGELVVDGGVEAGVRLMIQPKGKRLRSMELLSRGEKTMAAIAFILSLFLLRPAPFCLMDEVDAALDEANIERFLRVIGDLQDRSQFILVTHQRRTMEAAQVLYGVTMETPGVSKVLSLRLK